MIPSPLPLALKLVSHPREAEPVEITAARELAALSGARVAVRPEGDAGVSVSLASRGLPARLPTKAKDQAAWMWLRVDDHGAGEI